MRSDEILKHVTGPRVLDVGCAGHRVDPLNKDWLYRRLAERYQVTGIDTAAPHIAKMRELGYSDLHVQNAESMELAAQFDTITAGEIIEHVSNPGLFLARVKKHLSPHGRFVLTTPYAFSLMHAFYALSRFPKTCENGEHTCWFCPSTLRELAGREGLALETWRLIEDYVPSVTSWKYQTYWTMMRTVGRLLPERLRCTTMLMVFKHQV